MLLASLIIYATNYFFLRDWSKEAQLARNIDGNSIVYDKDVGINAYFYNMGTTVLGGEINPSTLRHLVAVAEGRGLEYLIVSSAGGEVRSAQIAGILLREEDITVIVPRNGFCASACLDILSAANYVIAHRTAIFGHHTVRLDSDEWSLELEELATKSPEFRTRVVNETKRKLIWTEAQRQIFMEHHGIKDLFWRDFYLHADDPDPEETGNVLGLGNYHFGPYYAQLYGFVDKVVR